MTENLISAIVTAVASTASTSLVAIVAILQNNKRFESIEKRFESRFEGVDKRIDSVDRTLSLMQADLKEFYRELGRHNTDIELLKKAKP